jgi:CRISPR-associated protein Csm3
MKLDGYKLIEGQIHCLNGLKIGGTKESGGMGETDNPVIRHPVTKFPYIPGSSLKGKIRSLLELSDAKTTSHRTGKPCECNNCDVCTLFGCGSAQNSRQPTRLIFRDALLDDKSKEELEEAIPGSFVEVKTEIQMDRIAGKAQRGALRQQERIPAGAKFNLSISLRLFEDDKPEDRKRYISKLALAFDLLEKDYLGGSGTRGYGQVKVYSQDGKPMSEYLKTLSL